MAKHVYIGILKSVDLFFVGAVELVGFLFTHSTPWVQTFANFGHLVDNAAQFHEMCSFGYPASFRQRPHLVPSTPRG